MQGTSMLFAGSRRGLSVSWTCCSVFLCGAIHELHYATCIVCMPCVARIAVEMSSVVLTEKPVVAMYV